MAFGQISSGSRLENQPTQASSHSSSNRSMSADVNACPFIRGIYSHKYLSQIFMIRRPDF